jgi:hypothetical protein
VFVAWQPRQSESSLLNPYSLACFLALPGLICLLLELRLLIHIRGLIQDYLR